MYRCGHQDTPGTPASSVQFRFVGAYSFFDIDSATGIITTTAELDRDLAATVELKVLAFDSGQPSLASIAVVTVNVKDINDHVPIFDDSSYRASIREVCTRIYWPLCVWFLCICARVYVRVCVCIMSARRVPGGTPLSRPDQLLIPTSFLPVPPPRAASNAYPSLSLLSPHCSLNFGDKHSGC